MIKELIGAGGSIIGTAIQALSQRASEQRTFKQNRQMADYQYSKDLEMWNRTNEYNSPEAQMSRLKAAGLNPNLIYGSGGAKTEAAQMPKYQAPTAHYNALPIAEGIQQMISTYQDIQLKNAQIKNAEASSEINQTKALWAYLSEAYRVGNAREKERISKVMADMMSGDYGAVKLDPKNRRELSMVGFGFEPSEWQKSQLQAIQGKGRAASLGYDKILADIAKTKAATDYQRILTDWYSGKAIVGMLGTLGGIGKGLFKSTKSGRANPEGLNRAQSKKLEEFKKKFIQNYER